MSQNVWSTINPATTSGNQLATLLNDFKVALMSGLKGPTRPTQLVSSGLWVDDSLEGGSNILTLKCYDGTQDINLFSINKVTGTASNAASESLFEILKTSNDTVGAKLRLKKKRTAAGQAQDGDTIGEVLFYGVRDDLGEALQARIYTVTTDNVTSLAQGSYMAFEVTPDAAASAIEVMRLVNNTVGIGVSVPEETLHVKGTGIKQEKVSDDVNAAKIKLHKKRLTGAGGVQSGDSIGEVNFFSKTSTSTDIEVARFEVIATELHTTTANGAKAVIKVKKNGATSFTDYIVMDNSGITFSQPAIFSSTLTIGGNTPETTNNKNAANGYCGLDGTGKVASAQLPAYVDDVLEFANLAALPATGTSGLLYVTIDTKKIYRWTGSVYVEISSNDVNSVNGYTGVVVLTKTDLTLGNVDNTSDATKNAASVTLTNKTITSPTINTPLKLDVKQDTRANLNTYATTATNGQICFATDTKEYLGVKDGVLAKLELNLTVSALTSTANAIAISLASFNNFSHTMTENTTLQNPTGLVAGMSGQITFTQHASAAKTLAFGTYWLSTDGVAPSISTTLSSVNVMSFYVVDATHIWFTFIKRGVA